MRGPGWAVVALATATVVVLLGLSVSTQGPGRERRTVRVNGAEAIAGEVLLKYRDGSQRANHTAIEAAMDSETVEALDRHGMRRLRSRRFGTAELIAMMSSDPDIEYVEPNYVVRLALKPNDPQFPSLWGLLNTGDNPVGSGGAAGWDIHGPDAWDESTGSRWNVIAILDTGIDYNHVDLKANMWSAPSAFQVTVNGMNVSCQAGTHGFNAITRTCDPMDDHFHGTHAAGTIGATGNNGVGVSGVNWIASMMAVKILGANGSGTVADAVAGIEFAIQAKSVFPGAANVRVLSNSWASSGFSTSLMNAIRSANDNEMLFVAAAGNNGTNNDVAPVYPASYGTPNMVSVAASTNWAERASFSNYGANSVHLAAPGVSILSTVPGNAYGVASGTSMAAPHVSGTALLTLSMCMLSTQQLKYMLLHNVDAYQGFAGITITGGMVSARAMLRNCPYPKVVDMTLTPSVASPQLAGTSMYWIARPQGGRPPYAFRWLLWDGTAWTTVQDWTVKPITATYDTFYWTPVTSNHSYKVMAQVRSSWNTDMPDLSVSKPFDISGPVSSVSLTSDVASSQPLGTTVTWTASATGGETPYEFQFKVYDGTWAVVQPWSASSTFTWTPSTASANYRVMAQVRGAGNTAPSGELAVWKPFVINPVATSVTLTPSVAAPRLPGTSIVWSAAASGGQAPYQYQFLTWDGVGWTVARAWNTSASYTWTPAVASANYFVAVQARSAWNTGAKEVSASRPFVINPPVASVALSPDLASPQAVGMTVSFTAAASGGVGPYQYQWSVYGNSVWSVVRAWSTNDVFAWTPVTAYGTSSRVKVEARGTWNTFGAERSTEVSYAIMPVVSGAALTPNLSSPRASGTTIRWTASPTGGQAPYQYRWTVWNGSVWTTMTAWTTSNTFDWTPAMPNASYKVGVAIRGSWNTGQGEFTIAQPFVIQ